ncbi:MAG: FkbM family methyltransferase [Minisyncoccia bacterium]
MSKKTILNVLGNVKFVIKQITPPIVISIIKKNKVYIFSRRFISRSVAYKYTPTWRKITEGALSGCNFFADSQGIASNMIAGNYDYFFTDYIKRINLEGKIIFDIGAHIGFDTLFFAKAVGEKGKVFAFEPNIHNKERLDLIIKHNEHLSGIISTYDVAISNKKGNVDFLFDDNIDGGTSSGSFIDDSHTIWEKDVYERDIGYKRTNVQTISLDEVSDLGIVEMPALIKIDVEGAEFLVIEGAKKLLKNNHPILLIEIHSIFNMLKVGEDLKELGYKIELLKEEVDGRCFIAATYNN